MTPEQQAVIDAAVAWKEAGVRMNGAPADFLASVEASHKATEALDAAVERMQAVRHG